MTAEYGVSSRMPLVLSKYERVQILAARVEQLLAGAPPLVDDAGGRDVRDIAEEEIRLRLLPMRIARRLPDNKMRVYDLKAFVDPSLPREGATINASPSTSVPSIARETISRERRAEAQRFQASE